MASNGTPFEGIDNIIVPAVYTAGLLLRVYTNTQDSLTQASVLADLTQPTGTGSGDITLNGTWSSVEGVVTYDDGTPDDPVFENSGVSNWSAPVTGYALHNGVYVLHFKDLDAGPVTMTPGKRLIVDMSTLVT